MGDECSDLGNVVKIEGTHLGGDVKKFYKKEFIEKFGLDLVDAFKAGKIKTGDYFVFAKFPCTKFQFSKPNRTNNEYAFSRSICEDPNNLRTCGEHTAKFKIRCGGTLEGNTCEDWFGRSAWEIESITEGE